MWHDDSDSGFDTSQRHKWIEENAYFRWVNEQYPDGQDLQHWREAEDEFNQLEQDITATFCRRSD